MSAIVITPAASARLVTPADVRTDLGLSADTYPDARLKRVIDQVSSTVATFCARAFGRQIYRERIYSLSHDGFVLDAGPQINRIIGLSILGGGAFGADEYALDDGMLRLTHGSVGCAIGDGSAYNLWHSLRPSLVVEYEAGWVLPGEEVGDTFTGETPLPADVEKAVIQLIGVAISEAGRDATIKSETVEGIGTRSYYVQGAAAALPHPAAEAALQRYRRLVLA